jgi:DMSO/TMAO reductase YedYZ heme-binding membrane subunit
MNGQLWWYVARAGGIVGWALVAASVVWGLLLSTRLLNGKPSARWLTDLHQFLGGLAVVFTGVHVGALIADNYTHFGLADVLVPLASSWRPGPVAAGVVALYLLAAVEITSLLRRRLPRAWWKRIHLTSYLLFWLGTVHGVTAGTDAANPAMWWAYLLVAATVLFLTVYRVLASRRPAAGRRAASIPASRPASRLVQSSGPSITESDVRGIGRYSRTSAAARSAMRSSS